MVDRLMRRDANRDGKLTAGEVPRRYRDTLRGGDTNGDGAYDVAELEDIFTTSKLGLFFGYIGWTLLYNAGLVLMMTRLFQVRWRVAD
jgi:hypothetical protein